MKPFPIQQMFIDQIIKVNNMNSPSEFLEWVANSDADTDTWELDESLGTSIEDQKLYAKYAISFVSGNTDFKLSPAEFQSLPASTKNQICGIGGSFGEDLSGMFEMSEEEYGNSSASSYAEFLKIAAEAKMAKKEPKIHTLSDAEAKRYDSLVSMSYAAYKHMKKQLPTCKLFMMYDDKEESYIAQEINSLPVYEIVASDVDRYVALTCNWKGENKYKFEDMKGKDGKKVDWNEVNLKKNPPSVYERQYAASSDVFIRKVRRFSLYKFGFLIHTDTPMSYLVVSQSYVKKLKVNDVINSGFKMPNFILDYNKLMHFWSVYEKKTEDFSEFLKNVADPFTGEEESAKFGQEINNHLIID